MTTRTRQRTTSRNSNVKQSSALARDLSKHSLLGEALFFGSLSGGNVKHQEVLNALSNAGLDMSMARKLAPKSAWSRACRKLEKDERSIEIVREDADDILFQFTKIDVVDDKKEGDQELRFLKETKVRMNKTSGKLTCKNDKIREHAQAQLDRCMEDRTSSDISNLCCKLFEKEAGGLIRIHGAIGAFFIPTDQMAFAEKIKHFLQLLGRSPGSLPIPKGTKSGDECVQRSVAEYIKSIMEDLHEKVEAFNIHTRQSTVEEQAERIKEAKAKVEAYAYCLKEMAGDLVKSLDKEDEYLLKRVNQVTEDKKNAPPDATCRKATVLGHPVTSVLRWMGWNKFSQEDAELALKHYGVANSLSPATIKTSLTDGRRADEKYGKRAVLSREEERELRRVMKNGSE